MALIAVHVAELHTTWMALLGSATTIRKKHDNVEKCL